MTADDAFAEEEWEFTIHELLASLPPVDPPEGFLQRAMDHRPKYAGRLSVASIGVVAASLVAIVGLGLVGNPSPVAPAVPVLAERHLRIAGPGWGDGGDNRFQPVDDGGPAVVLPPPYELVGSVREGGLTQDLYHHDGHAVSVFSQPGRVLWERLPAQGMRARGGREMWVDAGDDVVILEIGPNVVAVVGLSFEQVVTVLGDEPLPEVTLGDRLRALAREVSRQAGFP